MENIYELVTYEQTEFIIGVKYGRPNVRQHLHREMEIGLILEGEGRVTVGDRAAEGKPGDIWLANPWQSHEIRKKEQDARLVFLVLQVPSAFFSHTFP